MIKEVFSYGWETYKKHAGFLIATLVVAAALGFLPSVLEAFFDHPEQVTVRPHHIQVVQQPHPIVGIIIAALQIILSLIANMGIIKISTRFAAGGAKPHFSEFFSPLHSIGSYFTASVLFTLILLAGIALLVFPFFIWLPQFALFTYFIIDQNKGPIEALKAAATATHGKRLTVLAVLFLSILLNAAGFLVFGVGLLVTIPVTWIAQARLYQLLK